MPKTISEYAASRSVKRTVDLIRALEEERGERLSEKEMGLVHDTIYSTIVDALTEVYEDWVKLDAAKRKTNVNETSEV